MNITFYKQGELWKQRMKTYPLVCFFIFVFFCVGVREANAEIQLCGDKFVVTGMVRQMMAVHIGEGNDAIIGLDDRNSLQLARTLFQTEWTFKPNDNLKLFAKVRVISDQTEAFDSELDDYDAFPLSTARYGTYLRATDEDEFCLDVWELYADLDLGRLWLRLGKQQIAWGEMIAARILDIVNPLDLTWHSRMEPEEFENIRIPQWSIRGIYNFGQTLVPWLQDVYLEGYVNPGDFVPDIWPDLRAPMNPKPATPPVFRVDNRVSDRRGEPEFGLRVGARIGQFFGTLCYINQYSAAGYLNTVVRVGPPPWLTENRYPSVERYGMSLNHAFNAPIGITTTFEGIYTPHQPYYDRAARYPTIRDEGTFAWALRFGRKTFILPRPIVAANIQLQYNQTVFGNHDKIKLNGAPTSKFNRIHKTKDIVTLKIDQWFWYNQIFASFKINYDLRDAYQINPYLRYVHRNIWYFDIYTSLLGGSAEPRPGVFSGMDWADEIHFRVTYQF